MYFLYEVCLRITLDLAGGPWTYGPTLHPQGLLKAREDLHVILRPSTRWMSRFLKFSEMPSVVVEELLLIPLNHATAKYILQPII